MSWIAIIAGLNLVASDGHQTASAIVEAPHSLDLVWLVFNQLAVALLIMAMVFCLVRILLGPSLADRVLAADTLSLQVVGLVILLAIQLKTSVYLDAALVVAIIGFAGTLAFAQYISAHAKARDDP